MDTSALPTTPTPPTLKGTARERILDVASDLFYREGIRAVGVDAIIARSGVAKMTFYRHYKSKDLLVVEFLRRRDERWRRWLATDVERLAPTPEERPLVIFDALAARLASPEYRGCAFINTVAETADRTHPAHHVVLEHKALVRAYIRDLLQEAGAGDAARLAEEFMLLVDGALVTAAREGTPAAAHAAKRIAETLLLAARGDSECARSKPATDVVDCMIDKDV